MYCYVTGTCVIHGPNNTKLDFEFSFIEGYVDEIIGTPYNADKHGKHRILMI